MRRRALLSLFGATVLAGCGGNTSPDGSTTNATTDSGTSSTGQTTDTTTTTAPAVELVEHELTRQNAGAESELVAVTGTVRNDGSAPFEAVTVEATFLDEDGTALDSSTAEVTDLAAGSRWTFELTYPGVGEDARAVADYELATKTDG